MKLLHHTFLAAVSVVAIMAAGCGQNSKSDDVAQKDNPSAAQQTADTGGKMGGATTAAIDDSTITTKVKAAIIAEPTLSAMDIKVNTTEGVVTLSGTLDDPQKITKAEHLAQAVDGVKTVNNELVVKSTS
jgi:hyperosmotically inducible protein